MVCLNYLHKDELIHLIPDACRCEFLSLSAALESRLLCGPHLYIVSVAQQTWWEHLPMKHLASELGLKCLPDLAFLSHPAQVFVGMAVCHLFRGGILSAAAEVATSSSQPHRGGSSS